jgi:hypothetical protein
MVVYWKSTKMYPPFSLFKVQIQKELISDLKHVNQFFSKEIWESI